MAERFYPPICPPHPCSYNQNQVLNIFSSWYYKPVTRKHDSVSQNGSNVLRWASVSTCRHLKTKPLRLSNQLQRRSILSYSLVLLQLHCTHNHIYHLQEVSIRYLALSLSMIKD